MTPEQIIEAMEALSDAEAKRLATLLLEKRRPIGTKRKPGEFEHTYNSLFTHISRGVAVLVPLREWNDLVEENAANMKRAHKLAWIKHRQSKPKPATAAKMLRVPGLLAEWEELQEKPKGGKWRFIAKKLRHSGGAENLRKTFKGFQRRHPELFKGNVS